MINLNDLMKRITRIHKAEKVSKAELSAFSREALQFVVESRDVRPINSLLGLDKEDKAVLSPANRRIANRFFSDFVPFKTAGDVDGMLVFTEIKAKAFDKAAEKIAAFLADEENDIWTWQRDNINMEEKPVDYVGRITKATKAAIEKGHISPVDALKAVIAGGVSVDALMALVDEVTAK